MSQAQDRLTRLLGLVPYLVAHPGAELAATAQYFGVDSDTLIDDLELLFVTGRPGHMPDDLIDASWEDGKITLANADEVSVPIKLSRDEAASLLLAVQFLTAVPGIDPTALDSLQDKLSSITGATPEDILRVGTPEADPHITAEIRRAIAEEAALDVDYYVAARDELTSRVIAPTRIELGQDWLVHAWCYRASAPRRFALSGIRRARSCPHPPLRTAESPQESTDLEVQLTFAATAAWLADDLPASAREVHSDNSVTVSFTAHSQAWLNRYLLSHAPDILHAQPQHIAQAAIAALREPDTST